MAELAVAQNQCEPISIGRAIANAGVREAFRDLLFRRADNVPAVPCGATLSCLDGQCVDLCALIVCGEGTRCLQGRCMLSCDATQCDSGKTCVEGLCLDAP